MPEGPELKVLCDGLKNILENNILSDIEILSGRYLLPEKKPQLLDDLISLLPLKIKEINVKGKLLYFILENNWVILNTMGMSGSWTKVFRKHCHIEFTYNDTDKIWFCDPRRFGTIKILKDTTMLEEKLNSLGPDLLSSNISTDYFIQRMKKHKKKNITKVLMNQSIFSGCGNYIKSESLYRSGISPHNNIENISDTRLENLLIELQSVMSESYLSQGATISTFYNVQNQKGGFTFQVYGRNKDENGNHIIKEKTPDGRTSHWVKEIQY